MAPSRAARPNFSGEWILNAQRTKLQVAQLANLERAELRIDHCDPTFRLWRRFVLGGQEHTIDFELRSDGEETASVMGTQRRFSRLTWDADVLVFATRLEDASGHRDERCPVWPARRRSHARWRRAVSRAAAELRQRVGVRAIHIPLMSFRR